MSQLEVALRRAADSREPATVLALLRITLGVCMLWTLWLPVHAEATGVLWQSPASGGLLPLERDHWLFLLLPANESNALHALLGVAFVGAAASTVGLGGRLVLLLTQQCAVALTSQNASAHGGYDTLLAVGFLMLACSACNRTLSVDCWLRLRAWTDPHDYLAWPRHALMLQLLCMYGMTGLQKIGLSWTPLGGYSALYYVLSDPTWVRGDLGDLRPLSAGLAVFTAVSWHWEQLAPLLLLHYYYRATREHPGRLRAWFVRHDVRPFFALVGLFLHGGVLVLLDVGPFSLVALSYYLCLWSPSEFVALGARFTRYLPRPVQ
jgi:hypothetical protein